MKVYIKQSMSKQNPITFHSHGGEGSCEKPHDWRPNVSPHDWKRCSNIWLAGARNIRRRRPQWHCTTTRFPVQVERPSTFKNIRRCLHKGGLRVCFTEGCISSSTERSEERPTFVERRQRAKFCTPDLAISSSPRAQVGTTAVKRVISEQTRLREVKPLA